MVIVRLIFLSFVLFLSILFVAYLYMTQEGGRAYIGNIIESKIEKSSGLDVEVLDLRYDYNSFSGMIKSGNDTLHFDGKYSFFPKLVDLDYKLNIKNLSKYRELIGKDIDSTIISSGNAVKRDKEIEIEGVVEIFDGEILYTAFLKDFILEEMTIKVAKSELEKIESSDEFLKSLPWSRVGNQEIVKKERIEGDFGVQFDLEFKN